MVTLTNLNNVSPFVAIILQCCNDGVLVFSSSCIAALFREIVSVELPSSGETDNPLPVKRLRGAVVNAYFSTMPHRFTFGVYFHIAMHTRKLTK